MVAEASTSNLATKCTVGKPRDAVPNTAADEEPMAGRGSGDDKWPEGVWSSTTEPRHLPGYSGFVPGVKFKVGQSFGTLTSSLLRDEKTSGSGHLVLTNFTKTKRLEETNRARHRLLQERVHNLVKDKYVEHMCVPGYTGHIPLKRPQFGGTYADDSFYALSEFANDQRRKKHKLAILKSVNRGRLNQENMFPAINIQVPLHPIAKQAAAYASKERMPDHISPYARAKDDPQKFIIPGYDGFVPRLEFYIGGCYSRATRACITEFNEMNRSHREIQTAPVIVFPEPEPVCHFHGIYPNGEHAQGMNPRYTGYIPGIKEKIGMSFGKITKDVRVMLHQDSSGSEST